MRESELARPCVCRTLSCVCGNVRTYGRLLRVVMQRGAPNGICCVCFAFYLYITLVRTVYRFVGASSVSCVHTIYEDGDIERASELTRHVSALIAKKLLSAAKFVFYYKGILFLQNDLNH